MTPYYEHAGITIYHGDCRETLGAIQPGSVSLVVTSPPYNQMTACEKPPSGIWATSMGAGFLKAWKDRGYSDDMSEPDYVVWQNALFAEIAAVCRDDASLFYNHQIRWRDGECLHPVRWFTPDGWRMRQEIIWNLRKLAKDVGCSATYLSRIVNGHFICSPRTYVALSELLQNRTRVIRLTGRKKQQPKAV